MVEIISILVTIAILTVIVIVPFLIIKTYLAIEKHFIKKDIKDNIYTYKFYLNKLEQRNKYGKRGCYIENRKKELKNKVDNYYNEIRYMPKDKALYSEKQLEQIKTYISKWETIYQHNWQKQYQIDENLKKWKKFHTLKTYNEEIIKQFIA